MLRVSLQSFLLVVGFTLLVGIIGLAYGFYKTASIDRTAYQGWIISSDVSDIRRFLCVGYMHNTSYIGGALSIVAAWIFHVIIRVRNTNS